MYEIEEIREILRKESEPEYAEFSSKLIPGENNLLGVRLLKLHKLAKKIADHEPDKFLDCMQFQSFEEKLLHGMVIGLLNPYKKYDFEYQFDRIKQYVPYIDNWSVCDSFCSCLKVTRTHKEEIWNLICFYLKSKKTYQVRFALVMMLLYYVEDAYYKQILAFVENLYTEDYYVKMAAAWTVSVIYVKYPTETVGFFDSEILDLEICKKALQKIVESHKITAEQRILIREIKKSIVEIK